MKHSLLGVALVLVAARSGAAQQPSSTVIGATAAIFASQQRSDASGEDAVSKDYPDLRERLKSYVETFNSHDAAKVAEYWAADGVSVAVESGERTQGRESLQEEFAAFFAENSGARLTGEATSIRMIRPDVAVVEGRATLFVDDAEPVESTFTAVLTKEGDQWLISSSHEQDLPSPPSAYDALKELEWLVGTWEDQSEGAQVTTTVRWSPNQAFLIRSFDVQYGEDAALQGTQVIGWDPLNRQFRTWTFNSDGSFGEGVASKSGDDWMLKLSQVLSDGRVAAATQVITRVDDDTISVQTIGQTVEGEPVPAAEPVTVVRTGGADAVSSTETPGIETPGIEGETR